MTGDACFKLRLVDWRMVPAAETTASKCLAAEAAPVMVSLCRARFFVPIAASFEQLQGCCGRGQSLGVFNQVRFRFRV